MLSPYLRNQWGLKTMLKKIGQTILDNALIEPGSRVVAGLSGGADSTALVQVLFELAPELGFEICCAHYNHGIRAYGAANDEEFVRDFCSARSIPLLVERADVPSFAVTKGLSIETAARLMRYDFLARAMKHFDAQRIAVAHHMDDNAESVLLHLIRGSGLKGLTGMSYVRGDIIRPLLDIRRSEIENFLKERGIPYCTDETNLIPEGSRNIVRLEIMPLIRKLNPAAVETIAGCAELLGQDESFLAEQAEAALNKIKTQKGYDREAFSRLPLPIKSRAVRIALHRSGAEADIERVHVEKIMELLEKQSGAALDVPHARVRLSFEDIIFENKDKTVDNSNNFGFSTVFSLRNDERGELKTPFGSFAARMVSPDEERKKGGFSAYLDYDRLEFPLIVRTRRDGDRFFPANSVGNRKLKDYFIAKKLDAAERDSVPLVISGGKIAFVAGYGIGESFKITENTRRVLLIEYSKLVKK